MDYYSSATSWVIFGSAVAFGAWYYYPQDQRKPQRNVEDAQHAAGTARRKRNEQEERGRSSKRPGAETGSGSEAPSGNANGSLRKRKAPAPPQPAAAPAVVVQAAAEPEEDDMSTRKWAEGMLQAQKGHELGPSSKSKEPRVKTVKQSNARDSSQGGADADDDFSPVRPSGDVSDMLEPAAKGPTSLRVTAPTKPQKEKLNRAPKEEVVETKKQRQNRQKAEERRLQREVEEQDRKKLEENQRRTAREARGEPARNGIPVSKPPAVSAWVTPISSNDSTTPSASNQPLLDTFDADSVSSSNGRVEHSTGPTSTSSAQWDHDLPSEEDQMAQAMKQSEDESGWTTVPAQHQKKSKKTKTDAVEQPPVALGSKTNLPATQANGKSVGFQALEVQYSQRTDADPNDASNWDA